MEKSIKNLSKKKPKRHVFDEMLYVNINYKNPSESTVDDMEAEKRLGVQRHSAKAKRRPTLIREESSTNINEIIPKTNEKPSMESYLELLKLPVKKDSDRLHSTYVEKRFISELSTDNSNKNDDDNKAWLEKVQRSKSCFINRYSLDSSSSVIRRTSSVNVIEPEWDNDSNIRKPALLSFKIEEQSLKEMGYDPKIIANWNKKKQLTKTDLYTLLRVMIEGHMNPNVLICTNTTNFNCHLMVLQCYSKFFREFTDEQIIFLPETKVTAEGFEAVYEWMTADNAKIDRDSILEIYRTANFLGIDELMCQCWHLIGDDEIFVEDAAFLLYIEAGSYGMHEVKELLLPRVHKFFLTAVASFDYLCLDVDDILKLLSSNSIGVNSEMEVFFSAVRWLDYKWPARKCFCQKLMRCIRFNLMPPWFLVTLQKQKMELEVNHVTSNVTVKKLIDEGLMYATSLLQFGGKDADLEMFLQDLSLERPVQRSWIFDSNCVYHHNINCPTGGFLKYELFLAYLSYLKNKKLPGDWINLKTATSDINRCCNLSVPSATSKVGRTKVATYCSLKCSSWCLSSTGEIRPIKAKDIVEPETVWSSEEFEEQSCIPVVTRFDEKQECRKSKTKCEEKNVKDYSNDKNSQELERLKYNKALLVQPTQKQKQDSRQILSLSIEDTQSICKQLEKKSSELIKKRNEHEKQKQKQKPAEKYSSNDEQEEQKRKRHQNHNISKYEKNNKVVKQKETQLQKEKLRQKCSSNEDEDVNFGENNRKKHIGKPNKNKLVVEKRKHRVKMIKAPSSEESKDNSDVSEEKWVTMKTSGSSLELTRKKSSLKKLYETNANSVHNRRMGVKDAPLEKMEQISEELCTKNCGSYIMKLGPITEIPPFKGVSSKETDLNEIRQRESYTQKVVVKANKDRFSVEINEKSNEVKCPLVKKEKSRKVGSFNIKRREDGGEEQSYENKKQRFLEKRQEERRQERSFFRKRQAAKLAKKEKIVLEEEEDEEEDEREEEGLVLVKYAATEEDRYSSDALTDSKCADFIKRLDGIRETGNLEQPVKPIHVIRCPSGVEQNSKTVLRKASSSSKSEQNVQNEREQDFLAEKSHKHKCQDSVKQIENTETIYLPTFESVECFKKQSQKLMIFGGENPFEDNRNTTNIGNTVLYYDYDNKKWKCLTHIPFPRRQSFSAVECLGNVYIIGGTSWKNDEQIMESKVYKFDTQSLKWSLETEMPEPRKDFAVVPIVGTTQICHRNQSEHGIFVIGGLDIEGHILGTVWYYDIKRKSWLQKCKLNTPRYGLTAVLVNNEIVAAGGVIQMRTVCCRDSPDNPQNRTHLVITNSVEIYRLSFEPYRGCEYTAMFNYSGEPNRTRNINKWTTSKTRLRLPRLYAKFCLGSNGHLYVGGGICKQYEQSCKPLGCIDCYDFRTKEWFQICKMDFNRHGHDMVEYMNALVIIGGVTGSVGTDCCALRDVFMYNIRREAKEKVITALPWPVTGAVAIVVR